MPENGDPIGVGELSRQLRDVLIRFEGLTKRMEEQFVRRDSLGMVQDNINLTISQLREKVVTLEKESVDQKDYDTLEKRVEQQEDNTRWLVRLIIGFVILAILGAIFAVNGGVTS